MSRIAKQPIVLPAGVTVEVKPDEVVIKGAGGQIERRTKGEVVITVDGQAIQVAPTHKSVTANALSGTYAAHLKNMIVGVTKGFEKKLLIEGVGYRYAASGDKVRLDIGFSHPVEVPIPDGIKVAVEKNAMTINGIDKELVGEFAARIRALKKTEPYKGKGIRYIDEVIRRKQGKKASS